MLAEFLMLKDSDGDLSLGPYSPTYFPVVLNRSFIFLTRVSFCHLACVADSVGESQVFDSDWNLPVSQGGWNRDQETSSLLPTSLLADKIPEGGKKEQTVP